MLEGRAAGEYSPGNLPRAKCSGKLGRLLLQQAIGGGQGADQGRQLQGRGFTGQERLGEAHALGLVMGLADAGVETAHPGAKTTALDRIGDGGVIGDGSGGHGSDPADAHTI